jgi:NAD(P) transhydrogenase
MKGTLKSKKGGAAAADVVLCDVERGECFVSDSAAAAGNLAAAKKVLIVPGYGLAVSKVRPCRLTV